MDMDVSGSGQIEPLGTPALGALVELAPLYVWPQGRFILTWNEELGLSLWSAGASFLAVVDS